VRAHLLVEKKGARAAPKLWVQTSRKIAAKSKGANPKEGTHFKERLVCQA
jgi:hypothetical protein